MGRGGTLVKDRAFEEKRRGEPHSVTDGCQNKMKHESVEGIKHECEI